MLEDRQAGFRAPLPVFSTCSRVEHDGLATVASLARHPL